MKKENPIIASAKKYRKWFVIGPLFKLTEAVLELLIPTMMVYIIDRGVTAGDGAYVLRMMPVMTGLAVLGYLSALVCQYVASLSSQGFGTELRNRLFSHVLRLPRKETDRFGAPALVNRINNDVNILQQGVAMLIRLAIRAPFICVGSLVMAALLNIRLTLVIFCALPFLIAAVVLVSRKTVPLFSKVQGNLDGISRISRENLSGARVIRAFSRTRAEEKRFSDECGEYNKAVVKVNKVAALLNPVTTLIMNVAVIAVLWFGGALIGSGNMTGGQIIAFINYISYMVTALLVLANLVTLFTKAKASYARIAEVFAIPAESGGRASGQAVNAGDGHADAADAADSGADTDTNTDTNTNTNTNTNTDTDTDTAIADNSCSGNVILEVSSASLRYGDDPAIPPAVENVSFVMKKGETLGLVGVTGSGKSSLVSLIAGRYPCSSGRVTVHGKVRVAAQQSILFTGTVGDNVRAGDSSVTDDQIWEALKIAQADAFVAEKGGLDAPVERGGVNFSGGQRQRLSVARALAGAPGLVILDDSFSALDNATASKMLEAIRGLGSVSLMIVSQRIGCVRGADRIIVLDDGRPAGIGTHAELLEKSEVYAEICRLSGEEGAEN